MNKCIILKINNVILKDNVIIWKYNQKSGHGDKIICC